MQADCSAKRESDAQIDVQPCRIGEKTKNGFILRLFLSRNLMSQTGLALG
jgi:hypothetical protein